MLRIKFIYKCSQIHFSQFKVLRCGSVLLFCFGEAMDGADYWGDCFVDSCLSKQWCYNFVFPMGMETMISVFLEHTSDCGFDSKLSGWTSICGLLKLLFF